jgi:acetate kinase
MVRTCQRYATGSGPISTPILIFNAGSSSLKLSLLTTGKEGAVDPRPAWSGQLSGLGGKRIKLSLAAAGKPEATAEMPASDADSATEKLITRLWDGAHKVVSGPQAIRCAGHRVVHGGSKYTTSTVITSAVLDDLRQLIELAPVHEEANIQGIEKCMNLFPHAKQVAVFDTAFHQTMPARAFIYPTPYSWYEDLGIRRYGFHGISHSFCAARAAELIGRDLKTLRLVTCHLGSGASLAAIAGGACLTTTMGFTPMDGVMMGTRSGSIDPGILLHLLQHGKYSPDDLMLALNQESGLMGVSGLSADMREIIAASSDGHERARLALSMYIERLVMHVGALLALLGGMDALVFTGGVGENSPYVREAVCKAFEFAGVACDSEKNNSLSADANLASPSSKVAVLAIKAREDLAIARECVRLAG